jgi:hypothetical protein
VLAGSPWAVHGGTPAGMPACQHSHASKAHLSTLRDSAPLSCMRVPGKY